MSFKAQHINVSTADFSIKGDCQRYIFLTGSDDRAQQISTYFDKPTVRRHPRQHNLYLGTLHWDNQTLEVGAISTGMGGPSADIIVTELILLGARRFLRVGTAGSLQSQTVHAGDIVIATAAVRDDKASWDYIFPEYPALSALEYVVAAGRARKNSSVQSVHFGVVHSKSSLYAREFNHSLLFDNENYMQVLQQAGVLATEMECAQLFILSSILAKKLHVSSDKPLYSGAILAIIGDKTAFSMDETLVNKTIENAILLSLSTTVHMALMDKKITHLFE